MDVISHALWAALIAKLANFKEKIKLNAWAAAFWGAMPDVFAFVPLFIYLFYKLGTGTLDTSQFSHPEDFEPPKADTLFINRLTHFLYEMSHSLMVFFVVFIVVAFIYRKPIWEMAGWLLHIIIDIPTHSFQFYPTPFLWPFSDYKFDGISWADPYFLVLNYLLIFLVYLLLKKTWTPAKSKVKNQKSK
jgi:hypothetical protein